MDRKISKMFRRRIDDFMRVKPKDLTRRNTRRLILFLGLTVAVAVARVWVLMCYTVPCVLFYIYEVYKDNKNKKGRGNTNNE